ncbi:unnamed protein product, partial [Meganyctiphanes norvegica]
SHPMGPQDIPQSAQAAPSDGWSAGGVEATNTWATAGEYMEQQQQHSPSAIPSQPSTTAAAAAATGIPCQYIDPQSMYAYQTYFTNIPMAAATSVSSLGSIHLQGAPLWISSPVTSAPSAASYIAAQPVHAAATWVPCTYINTGPLF